jgi:DNA polymerase-3 subunit gamma/tau
MREIQEATRYMPFGNSAARCIIIDEAHRLSGNAWDSLLKPIEEPPHHVAWFLCTTNPDKIPKTIKTRCLTIQLDLVSRQELGDLVEGIAQQEGMQLAPGVLDVIVHEAHGSPRQALVNLTTAAAAKGKGEAQKLLHAAAEGDASLELCRLVTNGGKWAAAMELLDKLQDENPESIRITVVFYLAKVVKSAKTDDKAGVALQKLDAFSIPYNTAEGMAPLLLSLGRVLLG